MTEVGRMLAEMAKADPLHNREKHLLKPPKEVLHQAALRLYKVALELDDDGLKEHALAIVNAAARTRH